MFLDRRRRGDPFLVWKVRIFSVAAGVALVGIWLDERWMTGTALALLLGGVLLRFLPKAGPDDDAGSAPDDGGGDPDDDAGGTPHDAGGDPDAEGSPPAG